MNAKPGRRDEIMDASLRLIERKGIQNLTTKNIAREVGFTEPGIYRHFASKEDILAAILERFRSVVNDRNRAILDGDMDPLDRIGAMYANTIGYFAENPSVTAAVFAEEIFQNSSRLSATVRRIMDRTQRALRTTIRLGQERGGVRGDLPDEQLALIVMGSFRLLVTRWRLSGRSFNLVREGAKLWETVRAMLSAER
ncbi:MAG TPA: TetR/AcrR family transcriptional regulator [Spirochaetota bacterium]|nr:TetR/AcrR family transcriptional regulator [Spirochaetota bacterium]